MFLFKKKCEDFILMLSVHFVLLSTAKGYPSGKINTSVQPEERVFPNGTVIGKYAYFDKEGNPIEVKYYADDRSYGVELNSVKMITKKEKAFSTQLPGQPTKETPETLKNIPTGDATQFDLIDSFKYPVPLDKYKTHETVEYKETKPAHYKNKYKNPEYEVYMQNDLGAPEKQCNSENEKVRIYNFEKESGKAFNAAIKDDDKEPQFCERF